MQSWQYDWRWRVNCANINTASGVSEFSGSLRTFRLRVGSNKISRLQTARRLLTTNVYVVKNKNKNLKHFFFQFNVAVVIYHYNIVIKNPPKKKPRCVCIHSCTAIKCEKNIKNNSVNVTRPTAVDRIIIIIIIIVNCRVRFAVHYTRILL